MIEIHFKRQINFMKTDILFYILDYVYFPRSMVRFEISLNKRMFFTYTVFAFLFALDLTLHPQCVCKTNNSTLLITIDLDSKLVGMLNLNCMLLF